MRAQSAPSRRRRRGTPSTGNVTRRHEHREESRVYTYATQIDTDIVDKYGDNLCVYCVDLPFLCTRKSGFTCFFTCFGFGAEESFWRTRKYRKRYPSRQRLRATQAFGPGRLRAAGMQDRFPGIRRTVGSTGWSGGFGAGGAFPPVRGWARPPTQEGGRERFARIGRRGPGGRCQTPRRRFSGASSHPKGRSLPTRPAARRARIRPDDAGKPRADGAVPGGGDPMADEGNFVAPAAATPNGGHRKAAQGFNRAPGRCRRGAGATSLGGRRRRGRDRDLEPRGDKAPTFRRSNARKGPAFRPVVASLPGDAMDGAAGWRFDHRFGVRELPAPGASGVLRGAEKREVLGPYAPDAPFLSKGYPQGNQILGQMPCLPHDLV